MKNKIKKIIVGILTSGGDSQGMNACIRAIIKGLWKNNISVILIKNGYRGIIKKQFIKNVNYKNIKNTISTGGTIIGSSRLIEFKNIEVRKQAIKNLKKEGISLLIGIGGNGTITGLYKLSQMGFNCIGIPATIDNDWLASDETIGFSTAYTNVVEALDKIRDSASSHNRCMIIEVMGRNCGDIAIYSAMASGADFLLVPEIKINNVETKIIDIVKKRHQNGKNHTIIIATENQYNIASLAKKIEKKTSIVTRSMVLGYIQRGGKPTPRDRFLATIFGSFAVELILKKIYNVAIGIKNNKINYLEFKKALDFKNIQNNDIINLWKNTLF